MKLVMPIVLLLLSLGLSAKPVTIKAKDGFVLHATHLKGKANHPAVLLLHQCNRDRQMYQGLAGALNKRGYHTLALDFRMYGQSVDETQSQKAIRAAATSRENYFERFNKIVALWPQDVKTASDFLLSQKGVNKQQFATIGASCGGDQSLTLSKTATVKAQVFLSTPLSDDSLNQIEKNADLPRFFIAGSKDGISKTNSTLAMAYQKSSNINSKQLWYNNDLHGEPLFEHDRRLVGDIVHWLEGSL